MAWAILKIFHFHENQIVNVIWMQFLGLFIFRYICHPPKTTICFLEKFSPDLYEFVHCTLLIAYLVFHLNSLDLMYTVDM